MSRRSLFYAIVASLAAASCAQMAVSPQAPPTTKVCTGAQCDIDVTVSGSDIVLVDFIFAKQAVNIRWNLPQGSPYTITIEIIDGGNEFNCMQNGPRQFMCNNRHQTSNTVFKYWVKLDGPNHLEKDPYIVND
jgi:hypothetical protein